VNGVQVLHDPFPTILSAIVNARAPKRITFGPHPDGAASAGDGSSNGQKQEEKQEEEEWQAQQRLVAEEEEREAALARPMPMQLLLQEERQLGWARARVSAFALYVLAAAPQSALKPR
jgi:hypothetical protein